MRPTPQQQAFLDEIVDGTGNITLQARAGCGKSSTILMAVDEIREASPQAEVAVVAFNKAIADEMKAKLEKRGHKNWKLTQAQTLHSMGWSLVRFAFRLGRENINANKVRDLTVQLNDEGAEEIRGQIVKLVQRAKGDGFGFFDDRQVGDTRAWYQMAEHYGINDFDDTSMMDHAIALAQRVYRHSLKQTDVVDFDDMILFPLVKNMRVRFQKDVLFVDEAQDLSRSRQALARKFVKPTGRMIVVGDDRQAIYGFSGADSNALIRMTETLDAKVMPLSVTWRCPRAVVELAQTIVPDIEAAPSAEEGEVLTLTDLPDQLADGETSILCRNTAPLVDLAYGLIRDRVPAKVEGRDIGEGLIKLATRWKSVKRLTALLEKLEDYRERETQKAIAKGKESAIDAINDRVDTVKAIAEQCMADKKERVEDLVAFVNEVFADDVSGSVVTLCTYHRSKGREWPRVILLEHHKRCPSKWAKKEWEKEQEANLAYVAFTRAQRTLAFLG